MYACEMQIYCYNGVKYSTRIKFHLYHLATMLWGKVFLFFLSIVGRFSTNFVLYCR